MSSNKLTSLPDIPSDPDYKTNLTKFYIDYNKLTGLPENIGDIMGKLGHLSARRNKISSVPESIGKLNYLVYLYINHHKQDYYYYYLSLMAFLL